jgi:excisionase family DNA binding protein
MVLDHAVVLAHTGNDWAENARAHGLAVVTYETLIDGVESNIENLERARIAVLTPVCEGMLHPGSQRMSRFREAAEAIIGAVGTAVCIVPATEAPYMSIQCTRRYRTAAPCAQCVMCMWNELSGLDPFSPDAIQLARPVVSMGLEEIRKQALARFFDRHPPLSGFTHPGPLEGRGGLRFHPLGELKGSEIAPILGIETPGFRLLLVQIASVQPADIADLNEMANGIGSKQEGGSEGLSGLAEDKPLLVRSEEAAQLLSLSRTTFLKLSDAGRFPKAIRLGRSVVWSREELTDWVRAGSPVYDKWRRMKKGR